MPVAPTSGAPRRFGANYTPSQDWMHAWLSLDLDAVRRDFAGLAGLGLDRVRIFPLWPILQPNRTLIREKAVADARAVVDVAAEFGLDAGVDVIQGHLSSFDFIPAWLSTWHDRSMFTHPDALSGQVALVEELGAALRDAGNFLGFTLGNETNQFSAEMHPHPWPVSEAEAANWIATLLDAAERAAPGRDHVHSEYDAAWYLDGHGFTPALASRLGAMTTVHSCIFNGTAQRYGGRSTASERHAEYLIELSRAFAGDPRRRIWLQEVGAPSNCLAPEQTPMDTYSSQLSGAEVARASRQFKENRVATRSLAPVGWGDGGGTTREMTGRARRLADLEGSARVQWTHPDAFFAAARAELAHPPVWVGELYLELHRGTLTSQHATKALHRRAEQAMLEAELWAATAAVRPGAAYPYDELDRLWQQVLLHEFHDILPGTSIAWVHREAIAALAAVLSDAEGIAHAARRALAGEGERMLRFTPTSVGGSRPLGAAFADAGPGAGPGSAPDAGSPRAQAGETCTLTVEDGGHRLENELVSILISSEGLIVSAVDRASGREAIPAGSPAGLLQLHQDFPNMWDAWDIDHHYRNRVEDITAVSSITASVVDGTASVVVEREFSLSRVTQTITLSPGPRTLLLRHDIGWHETEKLLKLAFPLDLFARETLAETQFGFQRRATHVNTGWEAAKFETSMHRFVLAQEDDGFGVALVNDSLYGYDTTRDADADGVTTTLRLSLLRAPRFPDPETDHGRHEIVVGLVIGADAATATAEGIMLNAPARLLRGAHEVDPLVTVTGDGIVVSGVKLADDRSGDVIVRVYESRGRRATGALSVGFPHSGVREVSLIEDELEDPRQGPELSLRPFEVRTLRVTPR